MRAARAAPAAVAFLTRIPFGRGTYDIGEGVVFFPVVGAALGAAVGAVAYGLAQVVPAFAAAGIALAVGVALTGALHLDGLADTADALGARSREAALAVMRDHAVGTYGAVALVLDLLVKAASLAALAARGRVVLEALAAGALSRAVPVALGWALPDVRSEGLGARFRVAPASMAAAALVAVLLTIPVEPLLIPVAAGTTFVLGVWFLRWLGGRTGDLLGAATELTETAVLVAAAALA
jgi:adenosylcobinamide-GDP ribazoletransferase